MKLALGTVQFGLDYGAFGKKAKSPLDEVARLLDCAAERGINVLDTAGAYGNSEDVLGELGAPKRFSIVTKVESLAGSKQPDAQVKSLFERSLKRLKCDRVEALMAHSAADLLGPNGDDIWAVFEALLSAGSVGRIGVSVYSPEEADALIKRYPLGIIQLPFSVFDQRALTSGLFDRLKAAQVEVHARSLFLQGFVLSDRKTLPTGLKAYSDLLARFHAICTTAGTTPLAAALGFADSQTGLDKLVVGVRSVAELNDIGSAISAAPQLDLADCASTDQSLINPSLWNIS